MRRMRLAAVAIAIAMAPAAPAAAATLHVHNTHDSGNGSLRKAIQKADPGDVVKVPGGHYGVRSGELAVTETLRIIGSGARKTVIDANRDSRVIGVDSGLGSVGLKGLTVREGDTLGMDDGGGIEVGLGTRLVLTRVAVLNNRAISNSAFSNGGGVDSADDVVIKQSLFAGNHGYNGGAVAANGVIRAKDSTFFNNFGGNPTYNGDGGAFDDEVELIDSTVVGNQCFNGDGCGGATYSTTTLKGTIIAGNRAYEANGMKPGSPGNPGAPDNCGNSAATSDGHNLDDHHDCGLAKPSDISGKNPKLSKLRDNGGQTKTIGFGHSSPAFNGGAGNCTGRDQRGVRRPQGPRCDIGAFELAP